jgi:hypothetical protein
MRYFFLNFRRFLFGGFCLLLSVLIHSPLVIHAGTTETVAVVPAFNNNQSTRITEFSKSLTSAVGQRLQDNEVTVLSKRTLSPILQRHAKDGIDGVDHLLTIIRRNTKASHALLNMVKKREGGSSNSPMIFFTVTLYKLNKPSVLKQINFKRPANETLQPENIAENVINNLQGTSILTVQTSTDTESSSYISYLWPFSSSSATKSDPSSPDNKTQTTDTAPADRSESLPPSAYSLNAEPDTTMTTTKKDATKGRTQQTTRPKRRALEDPNLFRGSGRPAARPSARKGRIMSGTYQNSFDTEDFQRERKLNIVINAILRQKYQKALNKIDTLSPEVRSDPAYSNLIRQLEQLIIIETTHSRPAVTTSRISDRQ